MPDAILTNGQFYRRMGAVQALQWREAGDHNEVGPGVRAGGGTLAIERAKPYSRRYVEPGDWIIRDADGRYSVITDEEFKTSYESL